MNAAVRPDDLLDALRAEIAGFAALRRILTAEAEALRGADADALSLLTPAKMHQVGLLQTLARHRADALRRAGLPQSPSGLRTWLGRAPDPAAADAAWTALSRAALDAKRQNEINGRLAARQRWHFDAALAALLQAAGVPAVYGADGRPRRVEQSVARVVA